MIYSDSFVSRSTHEKKDQLHLHRRADKQHGLADLFHLLKKDPLDRGSCFIKNTIRGVKNERKAKEQLLSSQRPTSVR